jgi:hypothetical protein
MPDHWWARFLCVTNGTRGANELSRLSTNPDGFIYTKVAKGREAANVILHQISKPPSLAFDAKPPAILRDALRPWCK